MTDGLEKLNFRLSKQLWFGSPDIVVYVLPVLSMVETSCLNFISKSGVLVLLQKDLTIVVSNCSIDRREMIGKACMYLLR